jgi:hypothetical protein
MERESEALRVALRVLGAITERRMPETADIEALRHLGPPVDAPLDELACEVIRQGTKRRVERVTGRRPDS